MKKQKRRSTRRRAIRGVSQKGITDMFTNDVLPTLGGVVIASQLPKLMSKVGADKYAKYSNYLSIGLGAFLGASQKGLASRIGLGLAVGGGTAVVNDLLDGQKATNGLGLLPVGVPSYRVNGMPSTNTAPDDSVIVEIK